MEPGYFKKKYDNGRLGTLTVDDIPVGFDETEKKGYGRLELELSDLYEAVQEEGSYPEFEELEAAVLHGSVLYRNMDEDRMPRDLDVLLVTDEDYDGLVVPEKTLEPDTFVWYGEDHVEDAAVYTIEPRLSQAFLQALAGTYSVDHRSSAIPLHLAARSEKQLTNAVEDSLGRDSVAVNAYRKGVPIVGKLPEIGGRDRRHSIEWQEVDGVLEGRLV